MTISEQDYREIIDRLARIEVKLEAQPEWHKKNSDRLDRIEEAVGRQNFVAAALGAFAAGVVLMIQWLSSRGA